MRLFDVRCVNSEERLNSFNYSQLQTLILYIHWEGAFFKYIKFSQSINSAFYIKLSSELVGASHCSVGIVQNYMLFKNRPFLTAFKVSILILTGGVMTFL